MGEALYARINPRHDLSEPARRYAYATPVDMAKELLTLRGESTMALSPASLVTRAPLFTGFITDPDGTAGGLSGTNTGGALTVGMEPGSLIPLPPGTDMTNSRMPRW